MLPFWKKVASIYNPLAFQAVFKDYLILVCYKLNLKNKMQKMKYNYM